MINEFRITITRLAELYAVHYLTMENWVAPFQDNLLAIVHIVKNVRISNSNIYEDTFNYPQFKLIVDEIGLPSSDAENEESFFLQHSEKIEQKNIRII